MLTSNNHLMEISYQKLVALLKLFQINQSINSITRETLIQIKFLTSFEEKSYSKVLILIERHKLSNFFRNNNFFKLTSKKFQHDIKQIIKLELLFNLKKLTIIKNISYELNKKGIKFLFIKGLATSQLLYKDFNYRGKSKDIDLFIDKNNINEVIDIFDNLDFKNYNKFNDIYKNNYIWKTYRNTCEHSLVLIENKNYDDNSISIDIHWKLSPISYLLPNFSEAYKDREKVNFNGFSVNTLSFHHTFIHSCAHCSIDQWMNINNLLDIINLSKKISHKNISKYRNAKYVKYSIFIANYLFKDNHIDHQMLLNNKRKKKFYNYIMRNQILPKRYLYTSSFSIINNLFRIIRIISIFDLITDAFIFLISSLFPTREFEDLKSRNLLIIPELLIKRIKRIIIKLKFI